MKTTAASSRTISPLVAASVVVGLACLALAMVSTASYAQTFAHPARVEQLGGIIPSATVRGAECFRIALACGSFLIPLCVWWMERRCAELPARRTIRALPTSARAWRGLLLILALGALLRFALAQQSLWYDEISAFLSFAIEGPGVIFGSYAVPTNHVPQTLATWFVWNATGSMSNIALRMPAILAGIAAIPVTYALSASVWGRRAALLGAWLVAVAPIPLLSSTEARGYSFVVLGALTAALALARIERAHRAADYALFAVACAFAAWSHPVAIVVAIAALLVGLWRDRTLAIAAVLAGVLAALLLSPLVGDVLATRVDYTHTLTDQPTLFSREGYEAFVGLTLSWSGWWRLPEVTLVVLMIAGAVWIVRDGRASTRRARATMLPFALAFAIAIGASLLLGTWIYARFLLFALPIGVLAITATSRMIDSRARLLPFVLIAFATADSPLLRTPKQPIEDAVRLVAKERAPSDAVATVGLADNAVGFYAQQFGFNAMSTGFLGRDLRATIDAHHPRFIIVLYPDRLAPDTRATLDETYGRSTRLEGWADWGHGAVEIWTARAAS